MRIDRLLCCLRFVKTRSVAADLAAGGHVRLNGRRVTRAAQGVAVGDVLTFPHGSRVRVIEVLALPDRRGPPAEARAAYRALDADGQTALAAGEIPAPEGLDAP